MLKCSFCGKDESEVAKLVAGPKVFICDECVNVAVRLMSEDPTAKRSRLKRVWERLRSRLHTNVKARRFPLAKEGWTRQ